MNIHVTNPVIYFIVTLVVIPILTSREQVGTCNRVILNLSKDDGYVIENWDTEGNVPYVTKNGSFYCGYDNPRSIAAKGEWILKNGMKGMMFWDYEGDDTMGTLRKALWNAVMKK